MLEVKFILLILVKYIWSLLWHSAVFVFTNEEGNIKETHFSCKPQQDRSLGFLINFEGQDILNAGFDVSFQAITLSFAQIFLEPASFELCSLTHFKKIFLVF